MNSKAAAILDQITDLPIADKRQLFDKLQIQLESDSGDSILDGRGDIESVLIDRVDGPFIPLDDGLAERVKQCGRARLAAD